MARLNEPLLPTESVEVVKRRFIRQNRELAKHNSAQSIRIRNLEIQTSQLLAENVTLRERVADLQGQLEGKPWRHGVAADVVSSVKLRLEEKMQDIAILVAELGNSSRPTAPTARPKAANTGALQEWHDAAAAAVAEAGPQYRLETIGEDKHFPRRTLNADEVRGIVDASESPDIGPPPVARFDELDPVKFDPPARRDGEAQSQEQESDALSTPFSVNLETRRKRKDGQPRLDIRRLSVFQSPAEKAESTDEEVQQAQALPIRAGSKRKLSAREDDTPAATPAVVPKEPFQFSRRTGSSRSSEPLQLTERKASGMERKALGAKNANVDVVSSPKKAAKDKADKGKGEVVDLKTALPTAGLDDRKSRERRSRHVETPAMEEVVRIAEPAQIATTDIILEPQSLPPKTPAALDIFSPASTETSATGPRDTPEPNITHGDIPGASRPGRRARSAVNYAEPSLNTKMRRPGKELADAVTKGGKPAAIRAEPRFKKDPDESATSGEEWKKWPIAPSTNTNTKDADVEVIGELNSPLRDKTLTLSQALRDTKEKEKLDAVRSAEKDAAKEMVDDIANGASGPAALTSAMRKRLGRPVQSLSTGGNNAAFDAKDDERRDDLAVYEFNESSPQESKPVGPDAATRARNSRRHSSVPSLTSAQDFRGEAESSYARSKPVVARPASAAGNVAAAVDSITAARRERAASRRRSMML